MSESFLSSRLIGMKTTNPRACSADVISNSEKNHFPVWFFMARWDGLERETEAQSRVSGYWSHWQVWGWNHSTHAAPRATATGWRNPSWRTGNPWKFLVQTTYPMTMIQEFREGPWRQCCGNIFFDVSSTSSILFDVCLVHVEPWREYRDQRTTLWCSLSSFYHYWDPTQVLRQALYLLSHFVSPQQFFQLKKKVQWQSKVVAHVSNLSTWEAETGGSLWAPG